MHQIDAFFLSFCYNINYQGGSMQRYFAKEKKDNQLFLYESDHHHIKNVMRNKSGDQIEVIYNDTVYICQIIDTNPLSLQIIDTYQEKKEMPIDLVVAISLVTEQKFDLILQKLTELGVSKIIPIKTDRSIIKIDENRIDKKLLRWQNICKEASEQSKRTKIPQVFPPININELAKVDNQLKLICTLNDASQKLNMYLSKDIKEILFTIGPEGGFTKQEETYLIDKGFRAVNFGKRVLRVETAAIYVASIINYIYEG